MLLQINAGAQGRSKMATTIVIQQSITRLIERYANNEISLQEFLDGLSFTVAKKTHIK
jgi:hypothetical protein